MKSKICFIVIALILALSIYLTLNKTVEKNKDVISSNEVQKNEKKSFEKIRPNEPKSNEEIKNSIEGKNDIAKESNKNSNEGVYKQSKISSSESSETITDSKDNLNALQIKQKRISELMPVINKFNSWLDEDYEKLKIKMNKEVKLGVQLAQERREALKELIVLDPKLALENKLPARIRNILPQEILAYAEEKISVKANYNVLIANPEDRKTAPEIKRFVNLGNRTLNAYVYGRRSTQTTKQNINLNGIAIDDAFAVNENPVRKLEPEEINLADLENAEEAKCVISGKSSKSNNDLTVAEVGGQKIYLCSGGHFIELNEDYIAAEGSSGDTGSGPLASAWTFGNKTVLYIIVKFSDQTSDPQSITDAQNMMASVDAFMQTNSYGLTSMTTTVAPTIFTLPGDTAYYVAQGDFKLQADARAVAQAAGYDYNAYNLDAVRWNGGPGGYGGQAYVGWRGCWLKSSSVGVAAHEFGHNYGLWHANFWSTSDGTTIGAGSNQEYGDSFDTMGSAAAGSYHFNAYERKRLEWLPESNTPKITVSGDYQLYSFDTSTTTDVGKNYGLQIQKDIGGFNRVYWLDFRQRFTSNSWLMNGIDLHWAPWTNSNSGSQLLDTTPLSPDGKSDSAIVIGRTYTDKYSGIHITPTGKGGTTPESIMVTVNLGDFAGNLAPSNSITASNLTPAINEVVNFTCTATDPEGDSLAYYWTFGNNTNSINNLSTQSKSFSAAGVYAVTCTVSDKKGGVNSQTVTLTVGSPTTFSISGKVRDASLNPIQGATVKWNSAFAVTNSNGDYTLSNLTAASYSVAVYKDYYTFAVDGFVNPVAVGPSVTNINFTATPPFTINASSDANGAISPIGVTPVTSGGSVTYNIYPGGGYSVASVLVDGVNVGAVTTYTFSNVTANHTISATFKPQLVISSSNGSLGYISPSGNVYVTEGASQTFTMVPNSGKSVGLVTVDGIVVGSPTSYTFNNVTVNHTINATFTNSTTTNNITASSGANGSIFPTGTVVVNTGNSQTFYFTPNNGYVVDTVTVDGTGIGNPTSYTFSNVTAAHSISVTYAISAPDTQAPTVPSGLSASSIAMNSFTLSWSASTDNVAVTGYEVFKNGVSVGVTASTSMSITGLTTNTSYNMTVRARDIVPNWSAQSASLSVTTLSDTQAPNVPYGLAANSLSATSFNLTWTATYDNVAVTGYEVFRGGVSLGTTASTSFAITGLTPSTSYSMTVRARDAIPNWSAQSTALSVTTTADTQAPSVPNGLTSSSITATGFTLSWNASTDNIAVTGYEVFKGGVSIGTTATNSFAVTGLNPSTAHSMTVRARDAVPNWSAQSSSLSVSTIADAIAPSVPAGLASSAVDTTSFTLSWTASTDNVNVTGYEVFKGGVSIGTTATTSFNVTGLVASTTYSMTVRARDAVPNWSAQSTALSVTTANLPDSTPPSVPSGLASSSIGASSFTLTWTASTDNIAVTGYEIFKGGVSIGTSATTSFNVTGLTPSTAYSMTVRARDAIPNWSAQSTALSVTTIADAIAPSVPTGLASSSITATSFTLSWTASSDNVAVTGYEIFKGGVSIGTSATTSFNVTGLTPSTAYSMTVRARDAVPNWSAQSTALSVTTIADAIAPSVPAGLTSSSITPNTFTLSWTASTDNVAVTGYEVFKDGVSIGTSATTSFNVTGLTPSTAYSMTVRARDAVPNWSAQSTALSVTTTADTLAPSVPNGLASSSVTAASFTLSWTASSDNVAVTGYEIFKGGVSIGTSATTSFNVTGLTPSTAYNMTVRARDAVPNWSAQSSALSVTTAADTLAPSIPTGLASSSITSSSFTLSWTASSDNVAVTGYEIFKDGVSIGTSATTSFNVAGLTPSTAYSMTVRARDAVPNWSAQSAALVVTTLVPPDSVAPSIPTGLSSSSIGASSFSLSWVASTDNVAVTGYEIYKDGVAIGTSATTTYNVTGLTPSTTYSFTVRARDAIPNWSAQSSSLSVSTISDTLAPSIPTGLISSSISSNSFNLSWSASTDNVAVTGYEVFKDGVSIGTTASTTMTVTGLNLSTTYSMTVKARDAVPNWSSQSTALIVTTLGDIVPPSVPNGLSSSSITTTSFTLSWSASTDNVAVTGYEIFKNGVSIGTTATTTFNVVGLNGSTTYNMSVRARDIIPNWSAQSTAFSVTTLADTLPPTVPVGLFSGSITAASFTLSWATSSDNVYVTGYEIFKNGVSIGTSATSTFSVTGLNASTTYSMTVRARDAVPNWSAQSSSLNVTTTSDIVAPSVPTALIASSIAPSTFTLSWNASTDNVAVTGYEIFKNGVSIGTSATTSFSVTGLSASTSYSMTVRARDAVPNWSAQSTALSVTTTADTLAPSIPTGLSSASLTSTTFTLNWVASTDNVAVTGYEIFKGGVSIGVSATNSFNVTGLVASTTYSFTVRARDAIPNWSAQSTALNVTTPISYNITASAGANGSISPSGTVAVVSGASQTFTMTPATGYYVSNVLVDGVSVGAVSTFTFSNVTTTHTISATFAIMSYNIVASAGANGSITPSGTISKLYNTSQTFTIAPNSGYIISNVLIDGVSIGAVSTYTFSNISAAHTIVASFVTVPVVYNITATAGANGSISPSGVVPVVSGNSAGFSFTPAFGYEVLDVLVDGVSVGVLSNYTFLSVTSNHTIDVSFKASPIVYTINASAGANGSITPNGNISVTAGNSQTFTFTPNSEFEVLDVVVDGASVGVLSNYTFSNVSSNHSIVVSFKASIKTFTIVSSAGSNGSISPLGAKLVTENTNIGYTITPASGFEIDTLKVDGSSVPAVSSYIFNNVISNHTIDVTFKAIPLFKNIVASAGVGGTISPNGTVVVGIGNNQNFTITASAGFEILDVLVDGVSVGKVSNYSFINVVADRTISATFKASTITHDIVSSVVGSGSITPLGITKVSSGGSQSYNISAASGHEIESVIVDGFNMGKISVYNFTNVTSAHSIEARFKVALKTYIISITSGANGSVSPLGNISVKEGENLSVSIIPSLGFQVGLVALDGVALPSNPSMRQYDFTNVIADHTLEVNFEQQVLDASKEMLTFKFASLNPPVSGLIRRDTIKVTLPKNVSKTNLVPTFTFKGKRVMVNNITQISGVTSHDFTNPIDYVVEAEDGSIKTYRVTVLSSKYTSPGSVSLKYQRMGVMAGVDKITLFISRSFGSEGEITANYESLGLDVFTAKKMREVSGSVTWASGDTSDKEVDVLVTATEASMGNSFSIYITDVEEASVGETQSAEVSFGTTVELIEGVDTVNQNVDGNSSSSGSITNGAASSGGGGGCNYTSQMPVNEQLGNIICLLFLIAFAFVRKVRVKNKS